ncbi:C-terminal binding protein [Cloacibacillus sp.]
MNEHFWIIDDEFASYDAETKLLRERHPDCEINFSKEIGDADMAAFAPNTDALICQISVPVGEDFLRKLKNCKVVSVYGAGYNNVDIAAARKLGISVTNVPGYCAEDVADYVMAAIYRNNKQIDAYHSRLSNGLWGAPAVVEKPRRISSQKLFIIGFGNIGRKLAVKAAGVGMSILYYDTFESKEMKELEEKIGAKRLSTIEEGLKEADIISIHMTLTAETQGFFNKERFEAMKPGMQFINASRGGVVDEAALIEAAKKGIVAAATLDVVVNEPPQADDPILSAENICVTPHISYLSQDSLYELQFRAARNASDVIMGKDIREIVNK